MKRPVSIGNLLTCVSPIFYIYPRMKKFIAPIVLFVLAAGLGAYLLLDFSAVRSSFDADAYLAARSRIDSLQVALYEAQGNPDLQLSIRSELESSWETLNEMRNVPAPAPSNNPFGVSNETMVWIACGVLAVILCIILLAFLAHRKKVLTLQMEAVKAEQRFKEPKEGLDDATVVTRPRPKKRSIIDEVENAAAGQDLPKMEFENEHGVPENKIMTTDLDAPRPQLRPTAKERITSAMQSLSDVLRSPRGVTRDKTMKVRAQSHNTTGDPTLQTKSPLQTSRFDRELTEKTKIMQMSRRGFPASAIASQLKIPQEQVEAVIKESLESGA